MPNPKPNQTPSQNLGLNTLNHFGVGVSNLERSMLVLLLVVSVMPLQPLLLAKGQK